MKYRIKRKGKAKPLGTGIALTLGGLLAAWAYRKMFRRGARKTGFGFRPGTGNAPATEMETSDAEGSADAAETGRLAEKWHSLDAESRTGHIPRDLEREPKNMEQSTHPD